MPCHCQRCSRLNPFEAFRSRLPLRPDPRPGAPWPWNGVGAEQDPRTHTSACLHPSEMAGVPNPPWARPASTLARVGAKILALTTPFTDQVMWSITCGSKQHPYPAPLLEDIRQVLHPGHQHTTPDGQPFYLELISQLANTAGDPDWQYPQILATGVPLGGLGSHPPFTGSVASQE